VVDEARAQHKGECLMKTTRFVFMLALTLLLLASLVGCTKTESLTPAKTRGVPVAGPDSYIKNIQAGIEPARTGIVVSPSEAKAISGMTAKLAKNPALTGNLKKIYAYIPTAEEAKQDARKALAMSYSNGLTIVEEAWPTEPDWAAETAVPTFNGRPPDEVIGAQPVRTKVGGFQGMLTPEWTSPGAKTKLPPQLQWWENGVRYHILPWKLGYTSDQLMKVAESMY
jgi:hypothetical protein